MRIINADALIDKINHMAFTDDLTTTIAVGMSLNWINNEPTIKLTNQEWIGFLADQFNISRTSAKEMLHCMMQVKKEDNFKKQFNKK